MGKGCMNWKGKFLAWLSLEFHYPTELSQKVVIFGYDSAKHKPKAVEFDIEKEKIEIKNKAIRDYHD